MTDQSDLDSTKMEAFAGKVIGDTSAMTVFLMANLGDRLGLFKALADNGPVTSAELATRAGGASASGGNGACEGIEGATPARAQSR